MGYRHYHTTLESMQMCIVVFAFCTLTFAAGDLETIEVCRFGWKADNGTCQKCRCNGGEEFNKSIKARLQQSETAGFHECPPCVPCPSGKFRIPDSPSMRCTRCRLDCVLGNKHWKVPCGNISRGECGNCYNGFEPLSVDPNSPCVEKKLDENPSTTVTPAPTPVTCKADFYLLEGACHPCSHCSDSNRKVIRSCQGQDPGQCGNCFNGFVESTNGSCVEQTYDYYTPENVHKASDQKENESVLKTAFQVISGTLLVVLMALVAKAIFIARKKRQQETSVLPTKSSDSMRCILSSNTTCNNDLNVDGPLDEPVRGELPSILTSRELDALLPVEDPNYPTMKFTESHCHELGKLISGDELVMTFYRELGMNETFYNPYRDKFYKDKIQFQDCVFGSLKDWSRATPNVTVDCVCKALKSTSFGSIIPEFLDKITTCKDIT